MIGDKLVIRVGNGVEEGNYHRWRMWSRKRLRRRRWWFGGAVGLEGGGGVAIVGCGKGRRRGKRGISARERDDCRRRAGDN